MLHTYRKTALIEAEQFNGSTKQITRYKVHIVGPTSRGDTSYFLLPGSLFRNTGNYGQLRITDVEVVLTQEKLYDLLEETHEKNFG